MRSWRLFFSSVVASVVSVFILVVPFCLFLHFYQGDLFVTASARDSSRGVEVMMYLTPFLLLSAFFSYLIVFRVLKAPSEVIETHQIMKVTLAIFSVLVALLFLVLFLDGVLYSFIEVFSYFFMVYTLLLIPLIAGLMAGNAVYLKIEEKFNIPKAYSVFYS